MAFLYTNNELSETENNPICYCNCNKNKVPKNKFNRICKRPHLENYRTLNKEIEEDTN